VAAPSDDIFGLRKGGYTKVRNTEREARSRELQSRRKLKLEEMRIEHERAFSASYSGDNVEDIRKQAVERAKAKTKFRGLGYL